MHTALISLSHKGFPVVNLPSRVTNHCLAMVLLNSGYPSMEQFANAVNARAWHEFGIRLAYDHISVKHWLAGRTPQNAHIVAAVLSEAWGAAVPAEVIWPTLRLGGPPPPAHLQPWIAARTLEALAVWTRCDMLSRRELLNTTVAAASGAAFTEPVARWLATEPVRLDPADGDRPGRIGADDVARLEEAVRRSGDDFADGRSVVREGLVGKLKYAVDLANHASYSDVVGNRLLATIAELSGLLGWVCFDSAMHSSAENYFVYGLQAARESTDPRAPLLVVSILSDMARHVRWQGRPEMALRLVNLALDQLPNDRTRHRRVRAMLWSQRGWALSYLGSGCLPEVRNVLRLADEMQASADQAAGAEPQEPLHRRIDLSNTEIGSISAASYLVMARDDRRLAVEAEKSAQRSLLNAPPGFGRNDVSNHIRLASVRFVAGEPDQACEDAGRALDMVARLRGSDMIKTRLRELVSDAAPYEARPQVRELRERVHAMAA